MTSSDVTIHVDGTAVPGRFRSASGEPRGAVVLCHPHPAFGGNMDVWLLPTIGEALAADGWAVLRFDFRSVRDGVAPGGESNGHAPERADLAAAVAWLRERGELAPGGRLVVGGWSLGALVALLYGLDDPAVTDWVGVAPAVRSLPDLPMASVPAARVAAWSARRVVVAGAHDQFYPPRDMAVLSPAELHVLADADHFLFDHDREVAALVAAALRRAPRRGGLRAHGVVRITPSDTGSRVTVRSRIAHDMGQPSMTDTVGVLESWTDGRLRIRTKRGELVELSEAALVAARIISD